jgi:NAD(P)-dependent dehydrogenase (short-subunit alcohol dehydrogenase family)
MKTAIVTGSTRGIGKAIADALSSAGYAVLYSGTKETIEGALPEHATYVACDVSKSRDRARIIRTAQ